MAKQWMQDNLWKIIIAVVTILAGYAVLTDTVRDMKPKVEKHAEKIVDLEKADIGIKASVDALKVQQEVYHDESDRKLDAILVEVRK